MTRAISFLTIVVGVLAVLSGNPPLRAAEQPRQRLSADFNWKFIKGDQPGADKSDFDDSAWRIVNLPHDWSIEGPYTQSDPTGGSGGYLPTGIGWYRRTFTAPETWHGKKVFVEFDGVYMNSDVWINGQHLGHRPSGYLGFEYDLTPYLNFGATNVLAVRVDNSRQPNSRWYSGSGIYRHVWVTICEPLHVAHWGTYVTTSIVSTNLATVRIRTQVQNDLPKRREITLVSQVVTAEGTVVATAESKKRIAAGTTRTFDQSVEVPQPGLWSLDSPNLYCVRTLVKTANNVMDDYETAFGIRGIYYDVNQGFLLNGQRVKMQGMCLHQDGGSVGAAVPVGVWERRLKELKDIGCNAIRMSHNPPAPEVLDLCDRMGFLVMDEAFDEWTISKAQVRHGYADYFKEWSQRDLIDMLQRDRNHPGIVIWGVGNEIPEQTVTNGADILRPLVETCHQEDPTRPVTAACDNVYTDTKSATPAFLNLLDIVGYNYVDRWGTRRETFYDDDRHAFPQRKFIGTESVVVGARGDYSLTNGGFGFWGDFGSSGGAPAGVTIRRPPAYTMSMIRAEQLWKFVKVHDYVIGDFGWTGIDYLGESRWPGKLSPSGMLDTCGFPKDNYYFYQSQWTTNLMLHLFPHWNWKGHEGQVIPVICYTSCDTVELFLNGKSFGVKSLEFPRQGNAGGWATYARPQQPTGTTADLHLTWDVPYESGTLKAVGYKYGQKVCEEEVHTTGDPAAIVMTADCTNLNANGRDVAQLTVRIVDDQGYTVPGATNRVSFDLQGAASMIGVDNGNPISHEDYKAKQRLAFHGRCLAIVQAGREAGSVRLGASAAGLQGTTVELEVGVSTNSVPVLP
ncbi:MAG TPA: glycoside hydrolase family 2 TIM barrel-domain containing protein [Verrucomicrobiae bacterium]|nr:glycoside hydrolase family 2 TIM barrel-domain containing protein [Verrucomicrobiae bacterium]